MTSRRNQEIVPRNQHTLVTGIVARISGCASQKEISLDDQVDHGKEEVAELYNGPAEYRVIATKGKGERLDRPELLKVEQMIRTGELDLLIMEDVGRLVRGTDAVRLWGIAVDHGTRCIAPNDCIDTIDESWEEDLISACRDHVGHNAHTSKRLKKKLMNRFRKCGGATPREIAGYLKPEGAKTYEDWQKLDSYTQTIQEGAELLLSTKNCSVVADFFNEVGFPVGKYCKRKTWYGAMVRRFYRNPTLIGKPGRGFRHTVKHHETGRRISVPNPSGPSYVEFPHLAHLDEVTFETLNATLDKENDGCGRKPVNGFDLRWRVPLTRTRFPGQHARCWYCGRHVVWGANGMTDNLMCSGSREWLCWNSIGFEGARLCHLPVDAIQKELYQLDGFDEQFAEMVREVSCSVSGDQEQRWRDLRGKEAELARAKDNLVEAVCRFGPRPMLNKQLDEFEKQEKDLARQRQLLELTGSQQLDIPENVGELRTLFVEQFEQLAVDSHDFARLFRLVVPEIYVYLVRLCDGGHPVPRAKVTLNLAGIAPDALQVPSLSNSLRRELTLDLFDPLQRERIRSEAIELKATGLNQKEIASTIQERPTITAVQRAVALNRKMATLGITSPYALVVEPPADYAKLRRHMNSRYKFQPLEGYVQPAL